MSRGARIVAHLLAGGPAASINLDDLDAEWRLLAEVMLDAPDRGAALEAALAKRPDGNQRWAELLAADALAVRPHRPRHRTRIRSRCVEVVATLGLLLQDPKRRGADPH
jgi:hypothetical protein